jgi:hypothetical protein
LKRILELQNLDFQNPSQGISPPARYGERSWRASDFTRHELATSSPWRVNLEIFPLLWLEFHQYFNTCTKCWELD